MQNKDFNYSKKTNAHEFDLSMFFEKIKILSELERVCPKTTQLEKDAAFIEALKPLLSVNLQKKASEVVKMLPFFSIISVLKRSDAI